MYIFSTFSYFVFFEFAGENRGGGGRYTVNLILRTTRYLQKTILVAERKFQPCTITRPQMILVAAELAEVGF